MTLIVAAGVALIAIGYLVIQFGVLVIDDRATDHEAAEGPAYDAETVSWIRGLSSRDSEFDEWCEQAIALTRDPADADLTLWEHELGGAS